MANEIIKGPAPEQPRHNNCRCVMVPVMVGTSEVMQSGIDYGTWFNRQPENRQIDILGPARFKLFQGGMKVNEFVADKKITTLSDLGVKRITRKQIYDDTNVTQPQQLKKPEEFRLPDPKSLITDKEYQYDANWENYKDKPPHELVEELRARGIELKGKTSALDITVLRQLAYNTARMEERFPGLYKDLEMIRIAPDKSGIIGEVSKQGKVITLMDTASISVPGYLERYQEQAVKAHWWVPGSPGTPIVHEFGHVVVDRLNSNKAIKAIVGNDGVGKYIQAQVIDYLKSQGIDYTENYRIQNLSEYAGRNPGEFVAEAFAEYMTSSNPRLISQLVGGFLEALWNR